MISTRETAAQDEEEGAEEEKVREKRAIGSARVSSKGSTYGCFAASYAAHDIEMRKWMVMCMWVRIRMITERKMSLSRIAMS